MNTLYVPLDKIREIYEHGNDNPGYGIGNMIDSLELIPTIDLSIIDTMIDEYENSGLSGQYIALKTNALQELKSRLSPKN